MIAAAAAIGGDNSWGTHPIVIGTEPVRRPSVARKVIIAHPQ